MEFLGVLKKEHVEIPEKGGGGWWVGGVGFGCQKGKFMTKIFFSDKMLYDEALKISENDIC